MNFLLWVLISGIVGTIIFIVLLIIRPVSKKMFSETWHYYSLLVPIIFLLGGTMITGALLNRIQDFRSERSHAMPYTNLELVQSQNHYHFIMPTHPIFVEPIFIEHEIVSDLANTSIAAEQIWGYIMRIFPYILLCWALGAVFFFGINIKKYLKYRRLVLCEAEPCPNIDCKIPVVVSRTVHTPMLIGIIYPVIVLPQIPLDDEELRIILKHEMIHYKRKDLLFKLVGFIANAVHWYTPVAYILNRQLNILCELSCDEKVVSEMDVGERKIYGETLLQVLHHGTGQRSLGGNLIFATNLCNHKKNIKRRLTTMMNAKKMKKRVAVFSLITAALVIGVGFFISYVGSTVQAYADGLGIPRYSDFDDPALYVPARQEDDLVYIGQNTQFAIAGNPMIAETPHGSAVRLEYGTGEFNTLLPGHTYHIALSLRMKNTPGNRYITMFINGENPIEGILELKEPPRNGFCHVVVFEVYAHEPISRIDFIYEETRNIDVEGMYIRIFSLELFGEANLNYIVNGMIRALGVDNYGNEILGWVRESDLELGSYYGISHEKQMELQRQRAERFYETGEYRVPINLYNDEYATEKIGVFFVIAYPAGQAMVHGRGGVIYGRPPAEVFTPPTVTILESPNQRHYAIPTGAMTIDEAVQVGALYIWDMFGVNIDGMYVEMFYSAHPGSLRTYWQGRIAPTREALIIDRDNLNLFEPMFSFVIDGVTGMRIDISYLGRNLRNLLSEDEFRAFINWPTTPEASEMRAAWESTIFDILTPEDIAFYTQKAKEFTQRHFNNSTVVDVQLGNEWSIGPRSTSRIDENGDIILVLEAFIFTVTDDMGRIATVTIPAKSAFSPTSSVETQHNDSDPDFHFDDGGRGIG